MSKKIILAIGILVSAPFALVNCAASGSGSIGDDAAGASSKAGDSDRSPSEPVESETTTTRTTTTTTEEHD